MRHLFDTRIPATLVICLTATTLMAAEQPNSRKSLNANRPAIENSVGYIAPALAGRPAIENSVGYVAPALAERPFDEDERDREVLAGHSQHGEAFNEGPRQAAYLIEGTGNVHLAVTTTNPKVQKLINQGVGQVHGYWYFEAERTFRQAAELDPDCAMAYWGMAKANAKNSKRSKAFIRQALKRKDNASPREQAYIDALNVYLHEKSSTKKAKDYEQAIKKIVDEYPEDLEALAEYGHHIYANRSRLKLKYEDIEKVLNKVLAKNPMHPVHHYRIHLWDYKDAKKALNSAARCGQAAPSIAHMWHMPGHIYSRLKRYEDAVFQQEASARVDHGHMMHDGVLPDQIHNFAHNNEWLIRNLIFIGRHQDAKALAQNMIDLPRHPKYNTPTNRKSSYYGRTRLFDVLSQYEQWEETIALCHSSYLPPTDSKTEQQKRLKALGVAYARTGKTKKVAAILADLKKEQASLKKKVDAEKKKQAEAVKKAKAAGKKAPRSRTSSSATALRNVEKVITLIQGHQLVQQKKYKQALPLLKKAGEDKAVQAWVQAMAGDFKAAITAARSDVKSSTNQVLPKAYLTSILWKAGKKDEAKKALEDLRKTSGSIQLGAPPFDRLAEVAEFAKFGKDWRVAKAPAKDVGNRPTLDSLGPFRWQPSLAPEWSLADAFGKRYASRECNGKPMVIVFYLGFGCLHCAEQIQALIPKKEEFDKAGIELLAISSEDQESLKTGISNFEKGKIPFPLLADPTLEIFKSYRVYDDFEKAPLHATFLIDPEGRILWRDISYEPFTKIDFLLEESQRLLDNQKFQSPTPAGGTPVTRK